MMNTRYIIEDNVRSYRKRENLTQTELEEWAVLFLSSVKQIEDGEEIENFIRLSDVFHVNIGGKITSSMGKITCNSLTD